MKEREIVIGHRLGLHARAAAKLRELAGQILKMHKPGDIEAKVRAAVYRS